MAGLPTHNYGSQEYDDTWNDYEQSRLQLGYDQDSDCTILLQLRISIGGGFQPQMVIYECSEGLKHDLYMREWQV